MWLLFFWCWWAPPAESPLLAANADQSFLQNQWRYKRFRQAWQNHAGPIETRLKARQLPSVVPHLFLRAFKQDQDFEVWAKVAGTESYRMVYRFPICALSGVLGPKRKQGDLQIPEGLYVIDRFNPASSYHLSLGINYPNRCDRRLADPDNPGDLIFIHGNCVTIGCLPIENDPIETLYSLCVAARCNGQKQIPVHIFPTRLDEAGLAKLIKARPQHADFWRNLAEAYRFFEREKRPPRATCDENGLYQL